MPETDINDDNDEAVDVAAVRREAKLQNWCKCVVGGLHFDYGIELSTMPHLFWRLRLFARSLLEMQTRGVGDLLPEDAEGAFLDYVFQTYGSREELSRLKLLETGRKPSATPELLQVSRYIREKFRHIEGKLTTGDAFDLNQEEGEPLRE